jgi:hypothetical protein
MVKRNITKKNKRGGTLSSEERKKIKNSLKTRKQDIKYSKEPENKLERGVTTVQYDLGRAHVAEGQYDLGREDVSDITDVPYDLGRADIPEAQYDLGRADIPEEIVDTIIIEHADLKWGKNLYPADGEGRVGKQGINSKYTLDMVKAIAYRMPEKPNIIIKAGKNAKWYIKKCPMDEIIREIVKMRNSIYGENSRRSTMYVLSNVI